MRLVIGTGIKVLIVDDSESMRSTVRRALEESDLSVELVEASDGAAALPLALAGDVELVLSDIVMPGLDGIQLLRAIRKKRPPEDLPVILITSQDDVERRAMSFEVGVNDYLTKPFSPIELVSRVRVQMRLHELECELRAANERVRSLEQRDELTGLANRRSFYDACQRELARARRHDYSIVVLMVDIDAFRQANQRVGDLVGDAIISEMGTLLLGQLRASDALARVSGQKFGILLPRADASFGQSVAERIQAAVGGHAFPGHQLGAVKVSMGLSVFPNGTAETAEEVLNGAQAALEQGKSEGAIVWSHVS